MTIIECNNVCKTYGKNESRVEALKQVSVTIASGEFVALEGPSGSGKSTLLQLMGGLDAPTAGSVIAMGNDLYAMKEKERSIFRRQNFGFVFQSFHLLPALKARENIILPLLIDKKKIDTNWFKQVVNTLHIDDRLDHLPSQLSGGQQQRVAIARAIMTRPKVIFADEPTGNLDMQTGNDVLQLMIETSKEANSALVVITHDAHISALAQRRLNLIDGAIVKEVLL